MLLDKKWMEYPFCFGEDPRDVNEYNTYAERMQGGNKILRAKQPWGQVVRPEGRFT